MTLRIFRHYIPARNLFFVCIENLAIVMSVLIASRIAIGGENFTLGPGLWLKVVFITVTCQACLYYNDLYDIKISDTFYELIIRLLQALGVAAIILAGVYFAFPEAIIARGAFPISIGICIMLIVLGRMVYSFILNHGLFNEKVIVVGSGELAAGIISEIESKKDCGYEVSLKIEELSQDTACQNPTKTPCATVKDCPALYRTASERDVRKIIIAISEKRGNFPAKELLECRVHGIEVVEGVSFYESLAGKLFVKQINPAWLIYSDGFKKSLLKRIVKRTEDFILSFVLLIVFLPLIAVVSLLIKVDSRGPVIFSQERMGKNMKPYRIYKFRSMVADAEKESGPVWAKDDDDRITRVGKWIRKLRIDEVPQLWNVLKSDMSFVGPRPERPYFVSRLESLIPYYGERFSVKPGITGWAQVCYGYGASVEDAIEKLNYDLFYIKNMSSFLDMVIILKTVKIVLFGRGSR
ncbi:MAG: TIGR03013 family PEP-CTERM/XrtA system glycosyltransferase [Desulfobacterales bacterium]